jgi:hypothetical protein
MGLLCRDLRRALLGLYIISYMAQFTSVEAVRRNHFRSPSTPSSARQLAQEEAEEAVNAGWLSILRLVGANLRAWRGRIRGIGGLVQSDAHPLWDA